MSLADRRIKCGVCKKWIEIGERIEFEQFRFYGRDQSLPVHPTHVPEFNASQERLRALIERSATDGPSIFSFKEAQMLPTDPSDCWVI